MIYRFLVLSNEVPDFAREISIDDDATFLEFYDAILDSIDFKRSEKASFFLCDEEWNKEQEITLVNTGEENSEFDILLMDETSIYDQISEEGQKLQLLFDYKLDRNFFIKLKEIVTSKDIKKASCTYKEGNAPLQNIDNNKETTHIKNIKNNNVNIEEDFWGADSYNYDELNSDGFTDLDGNDISSENPDKDTF